MAACCAADSILFERKLTRMKTKSFVRSMALLAAVALAVPAFAKPFAKTINISQNAKLGKSELKAGEYCLEIEGNKATVQKGKQVVAESEGRWEDRSAKSALQARLVFSSSASKRGNSVTPFHGTRERLHSGVASLLVILAAETLRWQDPVSAASGLLQFLVRGTRKIISKHQTPLFTH